ncbi:unnamed protein product [Pseudo-nitzschia multistriata]|uniref:Uncharacterized protein n=1 Tax=Pseudo-nitzschia multistriata TaxID=183589 RepID=A0A448ZH33_9STRA|nr:unnamed protein product [Pseudo-nitzschia multistriata]
MRKGGAATPPSAFFGPRLSVSRKKGMEAPRGRSRVLCAVKACRGGPSPKCPCTARSRCHRPWTATEKAFAKRGVGPEWRGPKRWGEASRSSSATARKVVPWQQNRGFRFLPGPFLDSGAMASGVDTVLQPEGRIVRRTGKRSVKDRGKHGTARPAARQFRSFPPSPAFDARGCLLRFRCWLRRPSPIQLWLLLL